MIPLDAGCTGSSARWCPVCGDCACGPRYEGAGADGERTLDDARCPLHGASSLHAREPTRDTLSLADALATAERERDELRERDAFLTRERIAVATALDVPYATPFGDAVAVRLARLTADRDTARSALDGLAAAVRAEREARILFDHADADFDDDAIDSNEYNAALTTWSAAHDAVRDALAGAPGGYVPAPVVRAYRDAALAFEDACYLRSGTAVSRRALGVAEATLDAALAAAEGR